MAVDPAPAPPVPVAPPYLPCTCPGCAKPAGRLDDTILRYETRHGHPAQFSLHELAARAGFRLVPLDKPATIL